MLFLLIILKLRAIGIDVRLHSDLIIQQATWIFKYPVIIMKTLLGKKKKLTIIIE